MRSIISTAAACLSVVAIAACGEVDGGSNTSAAEIREKAAIWEATQIDDYVIRYKVRCLCPTKEREIRVVGGRIDRVDYKSITAAPSSEKDDLAHHWYSDSGWFYDPTYFDSNYRYNDDYVFTVANLFSLVRNAHERAYAVNVTWDEALGYPVEIRVDWVHNGIDDEYQILLTRFQAPG